MSPESDATLSFPDAPKLELDQLIDQLVDRANDVKRVQGRLRALIRAIDLINGDLALDVVLRHIAEAARTLAHAGYGALGVIADDGGLEQFIHVGIDDDLVRRIGQLPEGKGLLGALISVPEPIRLTDLSEDPRSAGFPAHHPAMSSFLGVPIRVRGEVFGNLYLTESKNGGFSAEDTELVRSLALAAGVAIANARLYDDSRRQQRWLAASAEISGRMLAETGEDPLVTIARSAREIANADLVSIALVTGDEQDVMVEVAVGDGADELAGRRFPLAASLAGLALEGNAPLIMRTTAEADDRIAHLNSIIEVGPIMVVPLPSTAGVLGVLGLVRRRGAGPFSPADLEMARGFAGHASVALEFAKARGDRQRMVLFEDRDRIARDLHDHVIQQLFAIGLSLQGLATSIGPDNDAASKLGERVDDIDRTIRQIRTSIFELRGPLVGEGEGMRADLLAVTAELAPVLGFAPSVTFSGQIDTSVLDALADDVIACVREALTNAAKHAAAGRVDVDLRVLGAEVTLAVQDDGRGMPSDVVCSGLTNLRTRAELRGGTFEIQSVPTGGTQLLWKVPIA